VKTTDWQKFLLRQQAEEGKRVFSVAELANAADASAAVINVALGRLVRQGVIRRYVPGRYGLPDGVAVEDLVAAIDSDAYVTGAAALARNGFITQMPRVVECFTRRRHNRSRERNSALGTLVFVCVSPTIHAQPDGGVAGPAQALCDLYYTARRRGLDPRSLYTFRKLEALEVPDAVLARYPRTVRDSVTSVLSVLR
jgi:hypothetical protein